MVLATVSVPLRLKTSAPSLRTSPVPRLPVSPPAPTCSVPAAIVVVPASCCLPVSTSVPLPACSSEPRRDGVGHRDGSSLRLKTSVPSLMTSPEPRVPVSPPAPTCSVLPLAMRGACRHRCCCRTAPACRCRPASASPCRRWRWPPCTGSPLRLKTSVPWLTTSPLPRLPLAPPVADLQRGAGRDGGRAGVAVVAREHQRAGARAASASQCRRWRCPPCSALRAVEDQRAVVEHARPSPACRTSSAFADLQTPCYAVPPV